MCNQSGLELPTELEELVEPLSTLPVSEPLTPDTVVVAPDGQSFRIVALQCSKSQINIYVALTEDKQTVWLHETLSETEAASRSRHEAWVLQGLSCPLFPKIYHCFEYDQPSEHCAALQDSLQPNRRTFLVTEPLVADSTLADILTNSERNLEHILLLLAQIAWALGCLHAHGWVHLGLRPTHILLSKPIKILECSYATRIGEKPVHNFFHAGYSPPELCTEAPVNVQDDIYAVGAMLYQALTGQKIPETGLEMHLLPPIAGVRQILARCLGSRESRYAKMADLHQDLVQLKRRLDLKVSYSLGAATSIGLEPTRTTNQDAYAYVTGQLQSETSEQTWAVACLADGMGGMAAGEVASEVAVKAIVAKAATAFAGCREVSAEEQVQWVKQWVHDANQEVYAAMERHQVRGGCTLLCTCLVERRLTIAHVGDSRLYLLRENKATLLTRDHSQANILYMQKQIPLEQLRHHPQRNYLTRSLGDRQPLPEYYIDTLEQTTDSTVMELLPGDVLLLCSDGLWEPVLETDMVQVTRDRASDLKSAASALLKIALQRDAPDNATVILLRLDETTVPKEG